MERKRIFRRGKKSSKNLAPSEQQWRILPDQDKERILTYFKDRFGIEFTGVLYGSSQGRVNIGPAHFIDGISVGITIARISKSGSIKPTTNFIQIFGNRARKNVVELSKEEALRYLNGFDIRSSAEGFGYVILKHIYPLGCGFLRNGIIENQLPKARRQLIKYL